MKRFKFTLHKLQHYKVQILDREKDTLAYLHRQHQLLKDEKSNHEKQLTDSNEDYIKQALKGLNVTQVQVFKGYHKSLSDKIAELEEAIKRAEYKVAQQVKVVVEATKEVKTLEKLEEKQLEEYNSNLAKAEEKFIDEFILNQTYRAG